jgi:hypothetical protein
MSPMCRSSGGIGNADKKSLATAATNHLRMTLIFQARPHRMSCYDNKMLCMIRRNRQSGTVFNCVTRLSVCSCETLCALRKAPTLDFSLTNEKAIFSR